MQPILRIDLTTRKADQLEVPEDFEREYLGAASLATRLLYDWIKPEIDPLSPESVLLFMTGPLTGTGGPTNGRFVICGRSPATGLWAESNIGGFWGPELRKAGYSGLWVTGRAENPVYLDIQDENVEIRDAGHLWGMDTYEIQEAVRSEVGRKKARVAGIGAAGEKQIPFACILTDHGRVAGRTGLGAVMGAKNLKAVSVTGTGKIAVSHPETYSGLRTTTNKALKSDYMTQAANELGTGAVVDYFNYLGAMPKNYFSRGEFESIDLFSAQRLTEKYLVGVSACQGCVIACGRVVKVTPQDEKQKGPEYETLVGFGPNLGIEDPEFTIRANEICDRYGMDTISASNILGFAYRLYELGVIDAGDTEGMELTWGNQVAAEALLHQMVKGEGLGGKLGKGARSFGRSVGSEELAIQVNGLEIAYHDPRAFSGMGLVYATSPRGGCHNQSDYYLVEIGHTNESLGLEFYSRQGGAEKAENVALHQNWRSLINSLIICLFANVEPEDVRDLVNAAVGADYSLEDLVQVGERAWNLKRVINNRLGLRRENDIIPKPFLEALEDGGAEGFKLDFPAMLKAYYEARGWDWETGFPSEEKLTELGLGFVIQDLPEV